MPAEPTWTTAEAMALRERYDKGEPASSLVKSSPYSQVTVYRMLNAAGPPLAAARRKRSAQPPPPSKNGPPRHWTDADQQAAEKAYAGDASIRAIAASLGFSYGAVHKNLQSAGVKFRTRGGRQPGAGNIRTWTDEQAQAYRKRYEANESTAQIADSSPYSNGLVQVMLRTAGTTFRVDGRRSRVWTDYDAAAVRNRYEANESVAWITKSSPFSEWQVYMMLRYAGAQIPRHRTKPADGQGREGITTPPELPPQPDENGARLRWTDTELKAAIKAYKGGAPIRAIARSMGFSYAWVHRRLQLAGVQFRSPGNPHPTGTPRTWTDEPAQAYRKRYEAGESTEQIADSSPYSPHLVYLMLRTVGTTFRHAGRRSRVWTDRDAAMIRNRYEADETIASIVKSTPYARKMVYTMLHYAGAQIPRPRTKPADEQAES